MYKRKHILRLLIGLMIPVAAGLIVYDFRDRLPSRYDLVVRAAKVCADLPKLGIEGRYQNYPACPWTVRVGPKQTFSGILQGGEHGATFLPDPSEPLKGKDAWFDWRMGPTWHIWADDKAYRSLQRLKVNPFDPYGPPRRVKLRGWRTVRPSKYGYNNYSQKPHVLFVDEFINVDPDSQPATRAPN